MKIVYKCVLKSIDEALDAAEAAGRSVEKIVVTRAEMRDLCDECWTPYTAPHPDKVTSIYGIPIEVIE